MTQITVIDAYLVSLSKTIRSELHDRLAADGEVKGGDWVLEEGMVAPIHLLYPGGQFDRSWCEEVVEIRSDGGKPLFSWGFDPITGR